MSVQLKYALNFLEELFSIFFFQNETKKPKPKTDSDVHETMTTGGSGEASATASEDQHQEAGEPSDEIMESHNPQDNDH